MQHRTMVKHLGIHRRALPMHRQAGRHKLKQELDTHLQLKSLCAHKCKQQQDIPEPPELSTRLL